jgi:hypothetical protein
MWLRSPVLQAACMLLDRERPCRVVRIFFKGFLSPVTIVAMALLILIPLTLGCWDVISNVWTMTYEQEHELMEIATGLGVVLIGWGVAIEERRTLREIFKVTPEGESPTEAAIDHECHTHGVGLLILGLFAEICIEVVRLPNRILNTETISDSIISLAIAFLAVGIYVMFHLIIRIYLVRTNKAVAHG